MAETVDNPAVKYERGGVQVPCRACIHCNHFDAVECAVIVEQTSPKKK